ncbi:GAF domain-containing sensor histidine kinase [Actinomyces slackii]|uniref:Redox sensor histidine kinase response regulator devS n=1 Tax=Actinomyces slackii TaxID=52774 RepID=A0A3S4SKN5_9ACTO|nr:GAF domain-containing protein [Actinomyces slackii]VEG74924.1 Redox sensor histidine kinase response regulator devS [Actinomyces slackii]
MTPDRSNRAEEAAPVAFPGLPDDDLLLAVPSSPSPEDPAGVGHLAYAVHADQLASTRSASPGRARPGMDEAAVELIQAALRMTGSLRVPEALRRLVESACQITGAAWGTIAVLNRADAHEAQAGIGATVSAGAPTASVDELAARAGGAGAGTGEEGVSISNDLSGISAFTGAIEDEEPGSLLSAPLRVHGQVYGRLYLCDKPGGFTHEDVEAVLTLAQAAAVAVENARLYREARDREKWISVSQELTTLLLSGAAEDDALTLIARRVRRVARADTAALILPSVGDTWICEIADGEHAQELIGALFPPEGRARSTLDLQTGLLVESLARAWDQDDLQVPQLARFGSALYAPMIHRGRGVGVMLLLRAEGEAPFTDQDLEIAELVAGQATMAFELADAQHAEEMATLLDERARIGRDLHDLAIQQLFATGMQISAAQARLRQGEDIDHEAVCAVLASALEAVDDSVGQIRSIVRSLRDRDEDVSLVERLRREASLARTALGYAPSLLLSVDGRGLAQGERELEDELIAAVEAAVEDDIADDMVAVVREGLSNVARHARASSVTVDVKIEGVLPAGCADSVGLVGGQGPASGDSEPFTGTPVVEIVCRDDGVGVDPRVARRSGTANMAERARRHGGSFVIGPRARSDGERRGTCFTWRVPLDGR